MEQTKRDELITKFLGNKTTRDEERELLSDLLKAWNEIKLIFRGDSQ